MNLVWLQLPLLPGKCVMWWNLIMIWLHFNMILKHIYPKLFLLRPIIKWIESKGPPLIGNFNKHPAEQGWTIDFEQLSADVDLQEPSCPICGSVMNILMHEGWVMQRDVGYSNERRPIRIYYLSCEHDSTTYRPNRPIKSNEDAPPFNVHPLEKDPRASFWHSEFSN